MSFRPTVRNYFEKSQSFNIVIQSVILISVLHLTLDTVESLETSLLGQVKFLHKVYFFIFLIEYILRVVCAKKPLQFIFSFFGIIDLLSIMPTILGFGSIDIANLRTLRLIRVFRIFKLARYTKAINRLKQSFRDIKEELIIFCVLTAILLLLSSTGIYLFEKDIQPNTFKSIPHSLWWSVVTLTTVGYGDVYPVTTGGKIFTSILLLLGLGIVGVPTGLFASSFSKRGNATNSE